MDIISLLACFRPLVSAVTLRHFSLIIPAVLTMTGRMTMLGISRWTEKGGSYRTVSRFFATTLPWGELFIKFFETFKNQKKMCINGRAEASGNL